MRVVVIGGGIIGLATAYYLRERNCEVVVLEKSTIGAGSTDRANGGIRAQFSSPVSATLSQESIKVWETFEDTFGTDIEFRRPGYLFLARGESTAMRFKENVEKQNALGVESEFITPAEAEALCPELRAEKYVAATYCATDGFADPHLGLQGYSIAANEAGVEIHTNTEVTDILQSNGRVEGVETGNEEISADYVVNAAGAWARQVAKLADVSLPISPRRRQLVVVDPETPVPDSVPFTIDIDQNVHFRPEREGSAVIGGKFTDNDPEANPDRFKEKMDLDWSIQTIEHAAGMADYFGPDSRVKRGWAGLYAVTPDHHPIIEESKPGFATVAGFSGHGFMQSPAAGKVATELIVDGEVSLLDVSSLHAERFKSGSSLEEGTVIN